MKKNLMNPMLMSRRNYQILKDAELSDCQWGCLFEALLRYQEEGKLPENIDPVTLTMWKVIHADMKRQFGEGIR